MRSKFILSGLFLAATTMSVHAQVTLDVTKITCDQFQYQKISTPRMIGAWLSGFYNGKRDNKILNVQDFQDNLGKLEKFCFDEKNAKVPVMQAVEKLFGDIK